MSGLVSRIPRHDNHPSPSTLPQHTEHGEVKRQVLSARVQNRINTLKLVDDNKIHFTGVL